MSNKSLDCIADRGTTERYKLDKVSSIVLHQIQAIYRRDTGAWIKKDYFVRRAIRVYLEHLQHNVGKKLEEVEGMMKAIEGRVL